MNRNPRLIFIVILLLSGAGGLLLSLYQHPRISPSEITHIQTFHYPSLFVDQLRGDPQAGKKIFKEFCSACHSQQPTIDINAPRVGDKKVWREKRQWGVDALLAITVKGIGAMPARGGCFECSDEQLRAAVEYMLSESE
jgi:cytochrome c5